MDLYRNTGQIFRDNNELFGEVSWLAVMQGQGIEPRAYSPLADTLPVEQLQTQLEQINQVVGNACKALPEHDEFIRRYCAR